MTLEPAAAACTVITGPREASTPKPLIPSVSGTGRVTPLSVSSPFTEIARIVGRTPAACRQLASSGRRRIRAAHSPAAPTARQAAIIRDFKNAWQTSDIAALVALLDPDATITADGGGLAAAALHPIDGAEQIARYLAGLAARGPALTILERTVNGQPGLIAQHNGTTVTVFAFDITGDHITRIWAVRNPDKLRPWTTGSLLSEVAGSSRKGRSRRTGGG